MKMIPPFDLQRKSNFHKAYDDSMISNNLYNSNNVKKFPKINYIIYISNKQLINYKR